MDILLDPNIWASLLTLTVLELVLGVDNVVVISIFSSKLPVHEQKKARKLGITIALLTRILMLLSIFALSKITQPLFSLFGNTFSAREIVLLGGGLFLLFKGTKEIHALVEEDTEVKEEKVLATMGKVVAQIVLMDLVFSLDSVITAIGISDSVIIMIIAISIAMVLMLVAAESIAGFIEKHLSIKMLALSFLLLVGVSLVAEGFHFEIPKGYLYFGMGFSGFVEIMSLIAKKKKKEYAH
ncbi:Integral membrane protein TerC [Flexistipes sinusarabici DSM 4947]|uniref:Integral membrane protein TerC n=1 Tax=Flexistipes sinusarabici (strain ATCC 49648 / DSM 4947 / MAS 10) TaxID=717231 RepID=F8E723_FLESM|nr:TerC family protein [Flexistipes sinusarabici]AEI14886.1 Integral membrane protein TerC [Flexistipes sinusarabici DSM 4947]